MKPELKDQLFAASPLLYGDRTKSPQDTCMCLGIACGDGWFNILLDLTNALEPLIQKWIAEHPDNPNYPRAAQVKEKFGTLRFYMDYETSEMRDLIQEAEKKTAVTCEWCGAVGYLHSSYSWLQTLCPSCQAKRESGWRPWRDE